MPIRFRCLSLALLGLAGAGAACESKSPTAPTTSITLTSEAALDGWVQSDGFAEANQSFPLVGDFEIFEPGIGNRQIYSFDLSRIPGDATIESATLRLYQALVVGVPYVVLGNVIVDHVDIGAVLNGADYNGGTLSSNIGTLSTNLNTEYKTLVVTNRVRNDRSAGRSRSQFRLRFANVDFNNNNLNDYAAFTDAEDSCCVVNQPPQLAVAYR